MRRSAPAILLFFLSPAIGELLSGSAPPVEYFQPVGFLVIHLLYGCGAILARELTVRWQKGWLTMFVLGAAYGILEEGLMVKSFFDPNWMDIGILGSYGRWGGVNWVWSVELTLYHAIISIGIPVVLVGLVFPGRRHELWLGRRGLAILSAALAADVLFGFLFLTPYKPPVLPYLLTIIATVALVFLARHLPRQSFMSRLRTVPRPFWFWLTGFLATISFFVIFWGLPNTGIPPLVTILLGMVLVASAIWLIVRMSGKGSAWTGRHQVALVTGVLSFFIILSPIREFDTKPSDNPVGMTFVGLVALLLLLWLYWQRKKREEPEEA